MPKNWCSLSKIAMSTSYIKSSNGNTIKQLLTKPKKQTKVNKRQCAKKVVSDSPGLVDFAIGLVNFALNFFEEFKLQRNFEINSAHQNVFGGS